MYKFTILNIKTVQNKNYLEFFDAVSKVDKTKFLRIKDSFIKWDVIVKNSSFLILLCQWSNVIA